MATRKYAQDTKVPVGQTRIEIEALLRRYGADQFYSGEEVGRAALGFRIKGIMVRIHMKIPRGNNAKEEKERRRVFRAVLMIIKAKLEAVESGISLLEDEFLANTVMPDGSTVGEWARPQITSMYKDGKMPPLLPGPKSTQ